LYPDSGAFDNIDWGIDDHYLNVQIDTGSGLVDMGTTQFMAVPYALSVSKESIKINDLEDGKSDNDGSDNGSSIFIGSEAGLMDDETNNGNVGIGFKALRNNTTGSSNTGIGDESLFFNDTGYRNIALGNSHKLGSSHIY